MQDGSSDTPWPEEEEEEGTALHCTVRTLRVVHICNVSRPRRRRRRRLEDLKRAQDRLDGRGQVVRGEVRPLDVLGDVGVCQERPIGAVAGPDPVKVKHAMPLVALGREPAIANAIAIAITVIIVVVVEAKTLVREQGRDRRDPDPRTPFDDRLARAAQVHVDVRALVHPHLLRRQYHNAVAHPRQVRRPVDPRAHQEAV